MSPNEKRGQDLEGSRACLSNTNTCRWDNSNKNSLCAVDKRKPNFFQQCEPFGLFDGIHL